ncbi:MAG: precorrin-4 C(11)-methyltransferase [Desulfosarcina sp.]|nr:precorrin-4 C(11)-methyltransferase [Desulfosarcina sp.]MBC2744421.1 precorrin-4 C(11)-methyltransferase [Desulfosarcina sp.]MBC2767329.1 precorrin-4 C(11)-methyltransferase [Desulfosarcina sp.]
MDTLNPVIFCGAGPGDPDLITVKGQRALAAADLVVYAGSLVPEALLKWTRPHCRHLSSAGLHLEEMVSAMADAWDTGKKVVRLHTGDPSLYGAIFEQMAKLRERNVPYSVIPGITAAFAAAAALGVEYTLPEVSQTLILTRMAGRTPVPETESLTSLATHRATMAIYLSISMVDEMTRILSDAYGSDGACAVVYRASQPDQKILWTTTGQLADTVRKEKITRTALVVVGRVLDVSLDTLVHNSKLYDRHFAHGYRNAEDER